MKKLFTSESVTEGHPDKICDQISDAVVDAILEKDPMGRVAAETTVNTGYAMVMGEISTECYIDIQKIARDVIRDIGYDHSEYGFDGNVCAVLTAIDEQSSDIAMGVDKALEYKDGELPDEADLADETGAGDQGMMFGYACSETPELMPMPISLAHKLARRLTEVRKNGTLKYLRPDGKTQVTVEYEDDKVKRIDTIVISTQHDPDAELAQIRADLMEHVIKPVVDASLLDDDTKYFINPTGRFVIGGPHGDWQASQAESSSSTPTADIRGTAAALSAAKILQRLTVQAHMQQDTLPRTSLRQDSQISARYSSRTRSAWQGRYLYSWIPSAQARSRTKSSQIS